MINKTTVEEILNETIKKLKNQEIIDTDFFNTDDQQESPQFKNIESSRKNYESENPNV